MSKYFIHYLKQETFNHLHVGVHHFFEHLHTLLK